MNGINDEIIHAANTEYRIHNNVWTKLQQNGQISDYLNTCLLFVSYLIIFNAIECHDSRRRIQTFTKNKKTNCILYIIQHNCTNTHNYRWKDKMGEQKFKQISRMTCACFSLFAGLVIMALLQFVATINSGMLLYNKDFIFIEGSEFKHASECLPAEKDKVSRASSFTFTPTKKCSD